MINLQENYIIGNLYDIKIYDKIRKLKFTGYIQNINKTINFPVFQFDFYTHPPHNCFCILDDKNNIVSHGKTIKEMMESFNRTFKYVGKGYENINVNGTLIDVNEVIKQLEKTTIKKEKIDLIISQGHFYNSYGDYGEIKWCPKCQNIRDTSCSACGCGSCIVCGYRWYCNYSDLFISPEALKDLKEWKKESSIVQ